MSFRFKRTGVEIDELLQKGKEGYVFQNGLKLDGNTVNIDSDFLLEFILENVILPVVTDFNVSDLVLQGLGTTFQIQITNILPTDAVNKDSITYTSLNPDIASVTNSGLVTSLNYGVAEIKVRVGSVTKICKVNVTARQVPITDMTIYPSRLSISPKTSKNFVVNFTPTNATLDTISWEYDESLGLISGSGLNWKYTAKEYQVPSTVIKAHCKGFSASCDIFFTRPNISATDIELNTNNIIVKHGDEFTLTATLIPANATGDVQWSGFPSSLITTFSSDKKSVGIKVNKPGSTSASYAITATCNGYSDTCIVTVNNLISGNQAGNINVSNGTMNNNTAYEDEYVYGPAYPSIPYSSSNRMTESPIMVGTLKYDTEKPVIDFQNAFANGELNLEELELNQKPFELNGEQKTYSLVLVPVDFQKGYSVMNINAFEEEEMWPMTSNPYVCANAIINKENVVYEGVEYFAYAIYNYKTPTTHKINIRLNNEL